MTKERAHEIMIKVQNKTATAEEKLLIRLAFAILNKSIFNTGG